MVSYYGTSGRQPAVDLSDPRPCQSHRRESSEATEHVVDELRTAIHFALLITWGGDRQPACPESGNPVGTVAS
jgi:hypothetical protein